MRLALTAVLTAALAACAGRDPVPPVADASGDTTGAAAEGPAAPAAAAGAYDLARPDATFRLPAELREISGLGVLPGGSLAAVQDETGVLYVLDPASGAVTARQPFRGRGDYEGVEHAAGATWVLRSNGTLDALPDGGGEATEHETPLKGRCDAEGLALDAARNRLLIACKEDPGEGLEERDVRAVYAFDLATRALDPAPAFTLDRRALDADADFKASALAVHPATGEVYVLSSVRKALAVVGMDGRVLSVTTLPEALYPQPEGLAFLPDGTLFISNEGPAGAATLLRFAPAGR